MCLLLWGDSLIAMHPSFRKKTAGSIRIGHPTDLPAPRGLGLRFRRSCKNVIGRENKSQGIARVPSFAKRHEKKSGTTERPCGLLMVSILGWRSGCRKRFFQKRLTDNRSTRLAIAKRCRQRAWIGRPAQVKLHFEASDPSSPTSPRSRRSAYHLRSLGRSPLLL
jgi:hypothetical protein